MNALKNLLNNIRGKAAAGASGAGGKLPNAGAALGTVAMLGAVGGIGYGVYHSMVTIQPGHRAIVYSRLGGLNEQITLNEGLNFVIPWFQRVIDFDVRSRPQLINSQSGSKDLQIVQIAIRVLYRPDAGDLPFVYRRLGRDFDERVLPSIVNEVSKAVIAQYNAAELLTKREQVSLQIRQKLVARASDFKIVLDDVAITHLAFSKEYTAAVEAKQVAQQDAERSKYIVERAIQEKKSIIIKAQGEAKSAELIGKAVKSNPAFVTLRRIDAAREVAGTISSSQNKIFLDSSTLMLNQLGGTMGDSLAGEPAAASVSVSVEAPKNNSWF